MRDSTLPTNVVPPFGSRYSKNANTASINPTAVKKLPLKGEWSFGVLLSPPPGGVRAAAVGEEVG